MNPAKREAGSSGTWETNGSDIGFVERYATMPWQGIAKVIIVMVVKAGPWAGMVLLLLWFGWDGWKQAMAVQRDAVKAQNDATAVQKVANDQQKTSFDKTENLISTYKDYIEASKRGDAILLETVSLAVKTLDVNTQRLNKQELVLEELQKQGTQPARELLGMFREAMMLMGGSLESHARVEKLLEALVAKTPSRGGE